MRIFGRVLAIALLLGIPISIFAVQYQFREPDVFVTYDDRFIIDAVPDVAVKALGVHVGDSIDTTAFDLGDRARLIVGSTFLTKAITVVHAGRRIVVPFRNMPRPRNPSPARFAYTLTDAVISIGTLLLAAVLLWRRPGLITIAFAAYAPVFIYSAPAVAFFGYLDGIWYSAAVVVASVITSNTLASIALVAFILRFPTPLGGRYGATVRSLFNLLSVAFLGLFVWRLYSVPGLFAADFFIDVGPTLFMTAALVAIGFIRYAQARGDERRRLGWIAVGSVLAASGTLLQILQGMKYLPSPLPSEFAILVIQAGLPLSFSYAILRHRVLDIGFAINRTLVFSTITASLVVVVGALDWASGKLLGNSHLSSFVEAGATIALGAALSWFHGRVERGVDRLLFRRRYLADKRISQRIAALEYAAEASTVDRALVEEVVEILHLRSAAVFRRNAGSTFSRSAASGWDSSATQLPAEHILPRTLRAQERTVILADAGISDIEFPQGQGQPDIAIPIVVRHDFIGFVMYGPREGDQVLDPEEREMLSRLVSTGSQAYGVLELQTRRRPRLLKRVRAITDHSPHISASPSM